MEFTVDDCDRAIAAVERWKDEWGHAVVGNRKSYVDRDDCEEFG